MDYCFFFYVEKEMNSLGVREEEGNHLHCLNEAKKISFFGLFLNYANRKTYGGILFSNYADFNELTFGDQSL